VKVNEESRLKTKYKVLVGLAYPTSAAILKRIADGENVPWEDRKVKEVAVGDIVDDIPANSIGWLLAKGYIEKLAPVFTLPTKDDEDEVSE